MAVHIDSVTRRVSRCVLSALTVLATLGVGQWCDFTAPTHGGTVPPQVWTVALTGSAPDGHADVAEAAAAVEAAAAAAARADRDESPSAAVKFLARFSPLLGTAAR